MLYQLFLIKIKLFSGFCNCGNIAGVTSFNIDFAAKKVTVVGDVTPLSVLASISKVKNAQFWTTSVASASPANPTLKKQ